MILFFLGSYIIFIYIIYSELFMGKRDQASKLSDMISGLKSKKLLDEDVVAKLKKSVAASDDKSKLRKGQEKKYKRWF